MRSLLTILALVVLSLPVPEVAAQEVCDSRVLVSSYRSNDIKVYDGCSGAFVQAMEGGGLSGPQAIREGSDGYLYVVSEGNNRIIRFDARTLAFVDVFVDDTSGVLRGPTALDFGPGGDLYVGGFASNNVVRYDADTGQQKGVFLSAGSGVQGIDAGMGFAPDGTLYVPGFDSRNVLRFGPGGQALSPLASGITQPRMILFDPGTDRILVSAWGDNRVHQFRLSDNGFERSLVDSYTRPTGLALHTDGSLLVTSDQVNGVTRFNASTGERLGTFIRSGAGGLDGATFIHVLDGPVTEPPSPIPDETADLYWLSGLGVVDGNRILVEEVSETSGTAFGAAFDPDDVAYRRWGSLEIRFTGCTAADFAWTSEGGDSLGFGSGGYAVQPVAEGINIQRCLEQGFESAGSDDLSWAAGGWFGGAARSGEGLMLDVIDDRAFVTWFTYRPPVSQ